MRHALAVSLATAIALALIALAGAGTNRSYVAHLSGGDEVPARDTLAQGQFVAHLSKDGTAIEYKLIVANIENVVAAHIHIAPLGVNGPVVVPLATPSAGGPPVTGTITAANLTGPLVGEPLSVLLAHMDAGDAYVNVHTNDFVPPTNTGPGDFPGGEIRGQIG